jgi:aryl-phospho-beta-D-glucosidase BglC (GH1 family)
MKRSTKIARIALIAALAIGVLAPAAPTTAAPRASDDGVATRRARHLRHGINTSHWFAQVYDKLGYTKAHFDAHTTRADIETIARLGFDHVRLSVEPAPMLDMAKPDELPAAYLGYLDEAIETILAQKLAVVVDIHPDSSLKKRLGESDEAVAAFASFWRALARHLSRYDADMLFLEILNEPEIKDPYRWMGIQAKVAAAIREGAPEHTILATGNEWSSLERLLALEPLRDPNVIYVFHFYEPHTFTHQGATWGSPDWPFVKELVYPSSPETVAETLARTENEGAKRSIAHYGKERWNAEHVRKEIARAAAWARRHDVPVVCNEFGAYAVTTPIESRLAWLKDVRTALEAEGIGWSMWDYAGGFRVVVKKDGKVTPDAAVVAALGLEARR